VVISDYGCDADLFLFFSFDRGLEAADALSDSFA